MTFPQPPPYKSSLSPGARRDSKAKRFRPLPVYTKEPANGELLLPSQPSEFACMSLAAGAATAARRSRSSSPQAPSPPSYESLYSLQHQPRHHPLMAPLCPVLDEEIEFLRDLPVKPTSAVSADEEDAECATCEAGVPCPVHPRHAFRLRGFF